MADLHTLIRAFTLMCRAREMAKIYEENRSICKYVHSTSSGHEAIQLATAFQLQPQDFVSPYYRDESLLLGLGFTPYQLMLQLLAKAGDIFSGGRSYYSHPSYNGLDHPNIIHQSSATGMQAIPTTGIAQGISYWEKENIDKLRKGENGELPIVVCSIGDASMTEGEVSEAIQFAVLKQLPIIYLVQDNNWGISVTAHEARAMNAFEYAAGFKGLKRIQVDGADFDASYLTLQEVCDDVRKNRQPYLVHASVPLLNHHTSGVRKEFYRSEDDLHFHKQLDPFDKLEQSLLAKGLTPDALQEIKDKAQTEIKYAFKEAVDAPDPNPLHLKDHVFTPTDIVEEKGERAPQGKDKVLMVDAALFAIREIMEQHPEAVLYGQDVGKRLGGVFREAATLGEQFGDNRVFNTAIQEAYIIGSTIGLNALGIKPIVEVQFADYIYPGLNQLVTEVSKSCYLSNGKFPVSLILRVPTGAYGGGGPYHSGSVESTLLSIKGIKVIYPSNAADMKGLMKAAYYDGNPIVMLEHKGLYWSKVPGTEEAKTIEPSSDYILPLGKANIVQQASKAEMENGNTCVIITYGMGVYWAKAAAKQFPGQVEIIDLRTLNPLDETLIYERVKKNGKVLVLTEETQFHSFAESISGKIACNCFQFLDAPVQVLGAADVPAVGMNIVWEQAMLPNANKVAEKLSYLFSY